MSCIKLDNSIVKSRLEKLIMDTPVAFRDSPQVTRIYTRLDFLVYWYVYLGQNANLIYLYQFASFSSFFRLWTARKLVYYFLFILNFGYIYLYSSELLLFSIMVYSFCPSCICEGFLPSVRHFHTVLVYIFSSCSS